MARAHLVAFLNTLVMLIPIIAAVANWPHQEAAQKFLELADSSSLDPRPMLQYPEVRLNNELDLKRRIQEPLQKRKELKNPT